VDLQTKVLIRINVTPMGPGLRCSESLSFEDSPTYSSPHSGKPNAQSEHRSTDGLGHSGAFAPPRVMYENDGEQDDWRRYKVANSR